MEYLIEYAQFHQLALVLAIINSLCFLAAFIIPCIETKHILKCTVTHLLLTIATFLIIGLCDSITALFVAAIFEMALILFECIALALIIGLCFAVGGIIARINKRHDKELQKV